MSSGIEMVTYFEGCYAPLLLVISHFPGRGRKVIASAQERGETEELKAPRHRLFAADCRLSCLP